MKELSYYYISEHSNWYLIGLASENGENEEYLWSRSDKLVSSAP